MPPGEVFAKMLQEMLELMASGQLRMDIDGLPLSTVEDVWGRVRRDRRPV